MNNLLNIFFFVIKNLNHFYFKRSNIVLNRYSSNLKDLKENGVTVIRNYFSKEDCSNIILEMKDAFIFNKNSVEITESLDHRLYKFEKYSKHAKDFLNDDYLNKLIKKYEARSEIFESTILAGNIKYMLGGKGSGDGWHRDRTFYKYKYSKAMIYLNDVSLNNGPFQYLEKSHKINNIIKIKYLLQNSFSDKWFENDKIEYLNQKLKLKINTVTANAGDLIVFDGTGIHRGKPLNKGERFSLTNYYRFDPSEKFDF